MTYEDLKELYAENEDFRMYIDRFCRCKNITPDQALYLKEIEIVARYYIGKGE